MGNPLVSVVLTNYNGERYLRQAVDSVMAQTLEDWELIIVDDASTDGSPEIIRGLTDPRIRAVFNERNSQVSYSHNRANALCRGRYIAALDNDDCWMPEKLEKQVAYMEAHPETGACFTLLELMDENGDPLEDPETEKIYRIGNMRREEWIHSLMTDGNHLANDSSLIRREVMDCIGENDLALVQLHDYDMWVKIPQHYEMYVLQEPLMRYRKERENRSITSKTEANIRRSFFEFAWIIGNNIRDMEDGLFRRAFARELVCPEKDGPEATRCEKAVLMMGDGLVTNCRAYAFDLLRELIAREDTRELLREDFHITQHDIHRMTGEPIYYDEQDRLSLVRLEGASHHIMYLEDQIRMYQERVEDYKSSFSWRITAPVRMVTGAAKKAVQSSPKLMSRARQARSFFKENNNQEKLRRIKNRLARPRLNRMIRDRMQTPEEELKRQREEKFEKDIRFSVLVPLYNTPEAFLREMIDSVRQQTYARWELCLADGSDGEHAGVGWVCRELAAEDGRILYKKLEKNGGISENTNACLEMATGNYIALFDHDDILMPDALYEVAKAIQEQGADYVYTDEIVFASPDRTKIIANHFKPDFAPDSLLANNYICHLSAFSREVLDRAGAFRKEFDGSQDHDLILRLTDEAERVVHVPKALYLWRSHPTSVAGDISSKTYAVDAGRNAVKTFLKERRGINAEVSSVPAYPTLYHVIYPLTRRPSVEIILDHGDAGNDIDAAISRVKQVTLYNGYRITVVCPEGAAKPKDGEVKTVYAAGGRSARLAEAARQSDAEMLLFLSEDLEIRTPEWISELLALALQEDKGAVGGRIVFQDNASIRHAGLILGLGEKDLIGRNQKGVSASSNGYFGQLTVVEDATAVSCECMMIDREKYLAAGGFDPAYGDSLFDADLCLRLREKGYYNVYTPFASLRGGMAKKFYLDFGPEWGTYREDAAIFRSRWQQAIDRGDPFYNPNLSLKHEDYRVR